MIPHPVCLFRWLWRSLRAGANVAGHDFKTAEGKTPPNVHILCCMTCGHQAIAWDWTSIEHLK